MLRLPPRSTLFPYTTLFRSETLSGEFLQVNRYLVADLVRLGLWTEETRNQLKHSEGSVQNLTDLPENLDRKSTRLNSSHPSISYAVFCLKKKKLFTPHPNHS